MLDGDVGQHAVAEIADVAVAFSVAGEDRSHLVADRLGWGVECGGVHISLQGHAVAGDASGGVERDRPIHANDIGSAIRHAVEPGHSAFGKINHGNARAFDFGDDPADGREGEFLEACRIEDSRPRIENLDRLRAGVHLRAAVVDYDIGDFFDKHAKEVGTGEAPFFGVLESFRAAALDHVGGEGPWRPGEADERHPVGKVTADFADRLHHEAEVLVRLHGPEGLQRGFVAERRGKLRPLALAEVEFHSHGLGDHENVRKENGGIHSEDVDRLEGDLGREVGPFIHFGKRVVFPDGAVFGQVAARLAHDPNRRALHGLAVAGAEEKMFFSIDGEILPA